MIILVSVLIAVFACTYGIVAPKQGEKFTSFYISTPNKNLTNYPRDLVVDEEYNIIIGLLNHEYETKDYTVEIWLIQEDDTDIQHMWFLDKISVSLDHKNIERPLTVQWEYNYSFSINRTGSFKLEFLLFTFGSFPFSYESLP